MSVHYSSQRQDWETPDDLFARLHEEFHFTLDVCATQTNAKLPLFLNPLRDGLTTSWKGHVCWCNPPYRMAAQWVEKAARERLRGVKAVMLIPARTDTTYFHRWIWSVEQHRPRPGIHVRFLKGRLKFKGALHGAPFPSMIVVFHPPPPPPRYDEPADVEQLAKL